MAEERSSAMSASPTLSSLPSRVYASTAGWLRQLHALLVKLFIQLSKQLSVSVTIVVLPVVAIAVVVGIRAISSSLLYMLYQYDYSISHDRPPPDFEQSDHPGLSPTSAAGERGAPLIREWSLQQSTLEEVFLRFCHRQQSINSAHLLGSERLADRPDDEKHVDADDDGGGDAEAELSPSPAPAPSPGSADVPATAAVVEPAKAYHPSELDQVRAVLLKN